MHNVVDRGVLQVTWEELADSRVTPPPPRSTQISANHAYLGLKWGRVARVGDPAPFDLLGL